MSFALLFWILMLFWLVYGFFPTTPGPGGLNYRLIGGNLLLFILLVLIGWKLFQAPLHP